MIVSHLQIACSMAIVLQEHPTMAERNHNQAGESKRKIIVM